MIRFIAIALCCSLSLMGFAQSDISGVWEGSLDEIYGEHFSSYKITLQISQEGDKVRGTSYIQVDDLFAEMSFVGTYKDEVLQFKEKEILREYLPDHLSWCIKKGALWMEIDNGELILVGPWSGRAGIAPCQTGNMAVKKALPRA